MDSTPASAEPLLVAQQLAKAYRHRRVVDGVSIQVRPGEIVGLLGPNGAGKTTTFNMVVGVVRPDEGRVHFREHDITDLPMHERARLGIGYLTQEPSVFRKLSVEDNLLAILETCVMDKAEHAVRLKYLLEELDLKDDKLFKLALKLEKIALEDEYFVARKLYPNVDFYSGIVYKALGIPVSMFTALFAVARTVGWIAQWNEMIGDPDQKIARPRQLYNGPAKRDFVPMNKRK